MKRKSVELIIVIAIVIISSIGLNDQSVYAKSSSQWYSTTFNGGSKNDPWGKGVIYNGKISKNKLIINGSVSKEKNNESCHKMKSKKRTYKLSKKCKYYGRVGDNKLYMSRKDAARQFKDTLKIPAMGFRYKIKKKKVVEIEFTS